MSSLDKLKPGGHSCGDSALRCQDCNEKVCPKCFVQCAVGNRCKKCAGRFTSHVLLVPTPVLLRTLGFTILLGIVFGFIEPAIHHIGYGFYGYLAILAGSFFVGKLVHRVAGYKMGAKITTAIIAGVLIGMAIGPMRDHVLTAIEMVRTGSEAAEMGNSMLGAYAIEAFLFALGLVLPLCRR